MNRILFLWLIAISLAGCINFSGAAKPNSSSLRLFESLNCGTTPKTLAKLVKDGEIIIDNQADGRSHTIRDNATDIVLAFDGLRLKWAKIGWMYSYGKMAWADIPRLNCENT